MSKLCRYCSFPMSCCKNKLPRKGMFENLQLFRYTMTKFKTTVVKFQLSTLFKDNVQIIINFNCLHTIWSYSIDFMWNRNALHLFWSSHFKFRHKRQIYLYNNDNDWRCNYPMNFYHFCPTEKCQSLILAIQTLCVTHWFHGLLSAMVQSF